MNASLAITAAPGMPGVSLPGIARGVSRALRRLLELISGPMFAITTAMCTSFKQELMTATHNFTSGGHNFRMALFDSTVTLDATTTAYSTANEVVGTGYTAGGMLLTQTTPTTSGTTAFTDFADLVWTGATFTARGGLIFNNSAANRAVAAFDFGANIPVVAGNLTVIFPTANASAAVLRIG